MNVQVMRREEFEELVQKLCPIIKRHLGASDDDLEYWAERLISHGLFHGFSSLAIHEPKDLAALNRVAKALKELNLALSAAAMTPNTLGYLKEAILYGPGVVNAWTGSDEAAEYAEQGGRADLDALKCMIERHNEIQEAVEITISEVKDSPFSRKNLSQLNVEAIGVVDACRYGWFRCKGIEAPSKDIKPSYPFAGFLADTMDACRVKGDPVSAFRAWFRAEAVIHRSRQKT